MRIHKHMLQSVALLLAVLMVVSTMPLSAAEGARAASIGSVSVVGAVDLRGVRINGDGTLFSGDRMNVVPGAYAKVVLGAGPKIEVGQGSDVTVTRDADKVQVHMASGNVAFKGDGKSSIQMRVGAYEITVPGTASGNVAYVGKDAFGVRVLTGSVSVRNTQTKQSFSVQKGTERLVSLATGNVSPSMAQLASAVPAAVPAMPQAQATTGLSKGGWIAILGTIAGAATAIVVLTTRNDDTDDDAATRLAQVTALQNLTAIEATATATATAAASVNTTATSAEAAINASSISQANKTALLNQVATVRSQANSASTRVLTLTGQIDALQNAITTQDGGPTAEQQQQLNQLLADLNLARTDANNAITNLNSLLSQAQGLGVGGLPQNTTQQVPPPTTSSASSPL
jgi:hypothetical protein